MRLYPKERKKKDVSHRRWRLDCDLVYEGGSSKWSDYYRTLWGAKIAAWFHYRIASYGGSIELVDTIKGEPEIRGTL